MQMESYSNLKPIRPFNKDVILPNSNKDPTDISLHKVVCCNFTSMLISLLQDKNLNEIENMVVNKKDPFAKYVYQTMINLVKCILVTCISKHTNQW